MPPQAKLQQAVKTNESDDENDTEHPEDVAASPIYVNHSVTPNGSSLIRPVNFQNNHKPLKGDTL